MLASPTIPSSTAEDVFQITILPQTISTSSNPPPPPGRSPRNTTPSPPRRPRRRTSTRNPTPTPRASRTRRSSRATSCTPACWRPRRRHATIPAGRLGGCGRVLDEARVGCEESRVDVWRGGLRGDATVVAVVLCVGGGEGLCAREGLGSRCLVLLALRTKSGGYTFVVGIPPGNQRKTRSCSCRTGIRRSTR